MRLRVQLLPKSGRDLVGNRRAVRMLKQRSLPCPRSSMPEKSFVRMSTGIARIGFTLIELLIVIAIIGVLVGLLMPAVQAARESARRSQCSNQLKQIGLAALQHENTQRYFPSGGWAWKYSGDADRGFGAKQPGGWAFNILPYLEEQALHDLGRGAATEAERKAQGAKRDSTPVAAYICPTRRNVMAYPMTMTDDFINIDKPTKAARTDYAANAGDKYDMGSGALGDMPSGGPTSYTDGDGTTFDWKFTQCTGVIFQRSEVPIADVRDGTTHTYLVGERYLNPDVYDSGAAIEDNQTAFIGHERDVIRYAHKDYMPQPDRRGVNAPEFGFGSAHSGTFNMVFCDGSVHSIAYDIDEIAHARLGNRKDGQVIDYSFE